MGLLLLLTGCAAQETFETVEDWYYEPVISAGAVTMSLPKGAAAAALTHSDGSSIYLCEGFTLCLQTLPGGDLNATLRSVSGFTKEQLEPMQTAVSGVKRYDFVWAAAGEGGDQLCRGALLDDGNYHYVLTVMADADTAPGLEESWRSIFSSFSLRTET